MLHHFYLFLALILCVVFFAAGCKPSSSATQDVQSDSAVVTQRTECRHASEAVFKLRDIEQSRQFFASRVTWPCFDSEAPVYTIESGSNADGAWFEGKAIFRMSFDDLLRDMGDPLVMGPSNVTKDLTKRNSSGDVANQRYDLHVEMDYIMTVEFDLTVKIDATDDAIYYESHKTSGTSMIDRIDEIIEVHALRDGWCSVAFQSRYDALVVKEKETRQHFDELFARWAR